MLFARLWSQIKTNNLKFLKQGNLLGKKMPQFNFSVLLLFLGLHFVVGSDVSEIIIKICLVMSSYVK